MDERGLDYRDLFCLSPKDSKGLQRASKGLNGRAPADTTIQSFNRHTVGSDVRIIRVLHMHALLTGILNIGESCLRRDEVDSCSERRCCNSNDFESLRSMMIDFVVRGSDVRICSTCIRTRTYQLTPQDFFSVCTAMQLFCRYGIREPVREASGAGIGITRSFERRSGSRS
jgi:hypothetical protein